MCKSYVRYFFKLVLSKGLHHLYWVTCPVDPDLFTEDEDEISEPLILLRSLVDEERSKPQEKDPNGQRFLPSLFSSPLPPPTPT